MIRPIFWGFVALVFCAAMAGAVRADMLVLADGRVVEGHFVAGSETFIQFRTAGTIQSYPLDQVSSILLKPGEDSLSGMASASMPATEPTVLPAGAIMVPSGTRLWIRFNSKISTASEETGDSFNAVLDSDLVVDGKVAAVHGSAVQGQVVEVRGGKKLGSQYLKMKLLNLTIGNQRVPLSTGTFGLERSTGAAPKLTAAELVATSEEAHGADAFAEGKDHVRIPKGTVLIVPLAEPVALYP